MATDDTSSSSSSSNGGPLDKWAKFRQLQMHFEAATKIANGLCRDVGWDDLAEDFDDMVDASKLQLLYDELSSRFGRCPFAIGDYESFGNDYWERRC